MIRKNTVTAKQHYRQPTECVMKNRCKTGPVVYQASLSIQGKEHIYIGATQDFKERYGNHKASFKNEKNKTSYSPLPIGLARKAWTRTNNQMEHTSEMQYI